MKKTITLLVSGLLMTAAFASCGNDPATSEEIKVPEAPTTVATTVATTTAETTKATTKKTTKATTTKAKAETTTKTSAKPVKPGEATPIGKWKISGDEDNEMAEYFANESSGMNLTDFTMEFSDDGLCTMEVESDVSAMMNLSDDGFTLYNELYSDITYDGTTLKLNADGDEVEFKRIGMPDVVSKYGKYSCDLFDDEYEDDEEILNEDYIIDFRSSGKTYMIVSLSFKYTYDAEKKIMNLMGMGDLGIEFDGNKMIMKTEDDGKSIFERIS